MQRDYSLPPRHYTQDKFFSSEINNQFGGRTETRIGVPVDTTRTQSQERVNVMLRTIESSYPPQQNYKPTCAAKGASFYERERFNLDYSNPYEEESYLDGNDSIMSKSRTKEKGEGYYRALEELGGVEDTISSK